MEGSIEEVLNRIENLLKHLLAVQLYKAGVNQQTIAKHLGIAKAKANDMLRGIRKGGRTDEEIKPQNS